MATEQDQTPRVGTTILTSNGEAIGHVKEITNGFFKVDAPMKPDYWLPLDTIGDDSDGQLHLNLTSDNLGDMKYDQPGVPTEVDV